MDYHLCDLDTFYKRYRLENLGNLSKWEIGIFEMVIFTPNVYRCFIYKVEINQKVGKYLNIGNFEILQEAQTFVKKFGELFNITEVKIFTPKRDKNGNNRT